MALNNNNNKKINDSKSKLELANKIADQSQKVASTYAHLENAILRIVRSFSSWIDKVLFNSKFGLLVSLGIAILMYFTVNLNSSDSIFGNVLEQSLSKNDITVVARYNSDTFEVSGVPKTADIKIIGEGSNVNTAANEQGQIVANLEGLTEGTHTVRLVPEGFTTNVTIVIDPTDVVVTLKKKNTMQFDVGYDFINRDKMNSIYSLGTPTFEYTKVNVRASQETLDSIAFVKALIDVSNKETDFEQEALLVAYDSLGKPVDADILPKTVKTNVQVTSPNKTVAINVEATGEVPDGKAIESITMDHETVTIYAPETILSKINQVGVTLDATTLDKDTSMVRPITLPSGVKTASVSQVNMDVKLGDGVTRVIENVKVSYRNNVNHYRASQLDETTISVNVFGTQSNVDKVDPSSIEVYFDMTDAVLGDNEFKLYVEQPKGALVKYSVSQPTYKITLTQDDEASDGGR